MPFSSGSYRQFGGDVSRDSHDCPVTSPVTHQVVTVPYTLPLHGDPTGRRPHIVHLPLRLKIENWGGRRDARLLLEVAARRPSSRRDREDLLSIAWYRS